MMGARGGMPNQPPRFNPGGPVLAHLGGSPPAPGKSPGGRATPILGAFHDGGEVTKDGAYLLEKGEKVTPAAAGEKRDSEYRRVYLGRKKKEGGDKK
jgi:hypothetical protein